MGGKPRQAPPGAGSVIVVVATDAPLFPSQCKAVARRVSLGLARTGTTGSHSSGNIFLAVSTANPGGFTSGDLMSSVGAQAVRATNAFIANEDMTGRGGHRSPALPRRRLAEILAAAPRM
jgi:L-aminopeptidase/D-esterase-like protein